MKVQVIVKNACKGEATSTLETLNITLSPSDTILTVKGRVSDVVPMPFPDQEIFFGNKALNNEQRLEDCGIKDGDSLEFMCTASQKTFVQQLSNLLGTKALSAEELSLLYVHRHGVTVGEALKALGGTHEKLEDFVVLQKVFALKSGLVTLVGAEKPAELSPIQEDKTSNEGKVDVSIAITVQGPGQIIEDTVDMALSNSDTVAKAKECITAFGQVPFPDQDLCLGEKVLADAEKLSSYGISHGAQLTLKARASEEVIVNRLEELVRARTAITPKDLSLEYCHRYGVPVVRALKVLGLSKDLQCFLNYHRKFSVTCNRVTLAGAPLLDTPPPQPPMRVVMESIMDHVTAATAFFNVYSIEQSSGPNNSGVTIFLKGLPQTGEDRWLPGLLNTLAASLAATAPKDETSSICCVKVEGDALEMLKDGYTVVLRISPAVAA